MSRGIGGTAKKVLEDDKSVIYQYGGYNLNEEAYRNPDHILDGALYIRKECLIGPKFREKLKRWNGGKKKRMIKWADVEIPPVEDFLEKHLIEIDNCGNCWMKSEKGYDRIASRILYKLLREYQHTGILPEIVGYDI